MNEINLEEIKDSVDFARELSNAIVTKLNLDLDPYALSIASIIFSESQHNFGNCNTGILMYFACMQAYQRGILEKYEDESIEASVMIGAQLAELFENGKSNEAIEKMQKLAMIQDNLWSIANQEKVKEIAFSATMKSLCAVAENNTKAKQTKSLNNQPQKSSGCFGLIIAIIMLSSIITYML